MIPFIVCDRNSFKPYYCLFLSVNLVSVATENYTGETGTEIYIHCAAGISNFLFFSVPVPLSVSVLFLLQQKERDRE